MAFELIDGVAIHACFCTQRPAEHMSDGSASWSGTHRLHFYLIDSAPVKLGLIQLQFETLPIKITPHILEAAQALQVADTVLPAKRWLGYLRGMFNFLP